ATLERANTACNALVGAGGQGKWFITAIPVRICWRSRRMQEVCYEPGVSLQLRRFTCQGLVSLHPTRSYVRTAGALHGMRTRRHARRGIWHLCYTVTGCPCSMGPYLKR